MSTISRYFQTVRHLTPAQIGFQLRYRGSGKLLKRIPVDRPAPEGNLRPLKIKPQLLTYQPGEEPLLTGKARFNFLNQPHDFGSVEGIDWELAVYGKLWTYNLHYFEYLRQPELPLADGQRLIDAWIEKEETFNTGWEPYPLSLRIVNWLQFYRIHGKTALPVHVHESFHRQYENLQGKIEFHLSGNHLLENLMALRVASTYFAGDSITSFINDIFLGQLTKQFQPYGLHYECSPLYHRLLLWRQLELITFGLNAGRTQLDFLGVLLGYAIRLDSRNEWPGPHFNDSTEGIAPSLKTVQRLAHTLKIIETLPEESIPFIYREVGRFQCWMDTGSPAPAHQPGHSHADNLTFCLHLDGRPIIVDTGISTYEKNERRAYERSTAAHNTVTVNGRNSSDVWGGFRIGRRAKTTLEELTDTEVQGSHNGYRRLGTTHRRRWYFGKDYLNVLDKLTGRGTGVARLHFTAGLAPELEGDVCRVGKLTITTTGATRLELVPYEQALGFNRTAAAWCLEATFTSKLRTKIEY